MSEEMKDPKEIAKHLIEIAGKKKTITYKDIIEALEKCQLEANQIEKIYEELENANIEIIEDNDEPNFEDLEDIEDDVKIEDFAEYKENLKYKLKILMLLISQMVLALMIQ